MKQNQKLFHKKFATKEKISYDLYHKLKKYSKILKLFKILEYI